MPADAGAPTMSGAVQPPSGLFEDAVTSLRASLTCQICLKLLYEPYTTSCGHTYCYECLNQWFVGKKKRCPECRTDINAPPAPAYLVRHMVEVLCKDDATLPEGETVEEHKVMREEMVQLVEQHKQGKGIFNGAFRLWALKHAKYDESDNVWRCPECLTELDDWDCLNCDLVFDEHGAPRGHGSDYSGSYTDTDDEHHAFDTLVDVEAHRNSWEVQFRGYSLPGSGASMWDAPTHPRFTGTPRVPAPSHGLHEAEDDDDDTDDLDDLDEMDQDVSDLIDDDDLDLDSSTASESELRSDAQDTVQNRSPTPLPTHPQSFLDDGTPNGSVSSRSIQDAYGRDVIGSPAGFSSPDEDALEVMAAGDPVDDASESDRSVEDGSEDYGNEVATFRSARPARTNAIDFEEEEEEEDEGGGYNQAGVGASSDDDSVQELGSRKHSRRMVDGEDSDDYDDEPVRPRKRQRLGLDTERSDGGRETSADDNGDESESDVSSSDDYSSEEEEESGIHWNRLPSRATNTAQRSNIGASHAPLRTVLISSDESDEEPVRARRRQRLRDMMQSAAQSSSRNLFAAQNLSHTRELSEDDEEPISAGRSSRPEASTGSTSTPHIARTMMTLPRQKPRRERDSETPNSRGPATVASRA